MLAEKNDIELLFIAAPYVAENKDMMAFNRIDEIADEYGIEFLNMNYNYDEIGIDFEKDFNDFSHLNYEGSCKFTDYLAQQLITRYGDIIPDRRGDERYSSWDNSIKVTEEMMLDAREKELEKKK